MKAPNITAFVITGPPGVGKTTLVRKICTKLSEHCKLAGFYTEEVRANGQRIGFDVVDLSGARGILARENPKDNVRRPKVGKYAVYVEDFENMALPLFATTAQTAQLLVVDEVGKMELFSNRFESAIGELLRQRAPMLVTVPLATRQSIPLVERLKNAPDAFTYHVTKANRERLANEISDCIIEMLLRGN